MRRESASISKVYNLIQDNIGKKVLIRTNQGRNRFDEEEGVIETMHPYVFCVKIGSDDDSCKTISFSYTDVLIRDVELVF